MEIVLSNMLMNRFFTVKQLMLSLCSETIMYHSSLIKRRTMING